MTSLITHWHRFQNWLKSLFTPEVILPSATKQRPKKTPPGVLTKLLSRPKVILTYKSGDVIKFDGLVIEGSAYVDESAIAGVSSPALIGASSAQCNVLAGTLVTEGNLTVESDQPPEDSESQNSRVLKHTIRVNLAILEKEITELNRVAKMAPSSADVTAAKALLEKAQRVMILEPALYLASSTQLGENLSQVFEAMRQSNQARHLLKACIRM